MITIALSKGRIFSETMPILNAAGICCEEDPETSRKLVLKTNAFSAIHHCASFGCAYLC